MKSEKYLTKQGRTKHSILMYFDSWFKQNMKAVNSLGELMFQEMKPIHRFHLLFTTFVSSMVAIIFLAITIMIVLLAISPNQFTKIAPCMLIVALSIAPIILYSASLPARDFLRGKVAVEEGIGYLVKNHVYRGGVQHYFVINDKKFRITRRQYNRLHNGKLYRVYYAPLSNTFFGAEDISILP